MKRLISQARRVIYNQNRIERFKTTYCWADQNTFYLYSWLLTPEVPKATNINFLLTISIHCQEKRLGELTNDHQRENDLIFY